VGLKETDLAMKVNINNRNAFPYKFFDTRYTISIDGEIIAEGYQPDPILINKKAITPVIFPVTLKPGKLLGMTGKMLFDKKDTPMVIDFRCKVIDKEGNNMFKNSKMAVKVEGTMAEFMNAAKEMK
jgi:LEA14-like dessication related protein